MAAAPTPPSPSRRRRAACRPARDPWPGGGDQPWRAGSHGTDHLRAARRHLGLVTTTCAAGLARNRASAIVAAASITCSQLGRALADRAADPVCEECPHPLGCADCGHRGKHQGVGLDDAGAGGRGRRSDCGPCSRARRPAARHRRDPGDGGCGLERGAKAGLCPGDAALVTKAYWRAVDSRLCSTCAGSEGDAAE